MDHQATGSSHNNIRDTESESEVSFGTNSKRKRNLDSPPKLFLPFFVSKWRRQHAEKLLCIHYAKRYLKKPEDMEQKITGSVKELKKDQKDYIDFVNKHLTFNLSLKQFYYQSEFVEEAISDCSTNIEKLQAEQKSRSIMKLKAFIRGLRNLFKNMRVYRQKTHPFEGLITGFVGKFADLCCLDVEYCNKAHQAVWENLKGNRVSSKPDLRLLKCGLEDSYPDTLVSVIEVKPNSYYIAEPMGSPKKKFKSNLRLTSSDSGDLTSESETLLQTEEDSIELQLNDKVLGQHAGQLLLDLHLKYRRDEEEKYEGEKKIYMLGMIVDGTSVFSTMLEMTWKHYQNLKKNTCLEQDDEATIYYSKPKDILLELERRSLMADFMRLNNIEFDST